MKKTIPRMRERLSNTADDAAARWPVFITLSVNVDLCDHPSLSDPGKGDIHLGRFPAPLCSEAGTPRGVRVRSRFRDRLEAELHQLVGAQVTFQNIVGLVRAVCAAFATAQRQGDMRAEMRGEPTDRGISKTVLHRRKHPPDLLPLRSTQS